MDLNSITFTGATLTNNYVDCTTQIMLREQWDRFNSWHNQWAFSHLDEKEALKLYRELTGISLMSRPKYLY